MIKYEYGNSNVNHLYPENLPNRYHAKTLNYNLEDNNLNISLLGKRIFPNSRVLDVACGEGKFTYLYKQKNIAAWGIDIDPLAVQYASAKEVYKEVICCDIEKEFYRIEQLYKSIGSKFDYIILCDVLEHFVDPTKVLENLYHILKDQGSMLISIPNVGNADIFLNLMEGNFNYSREGILDNTHFHFFTKKSFAQWIDEINEKSQFFSMDCIYLGGTFGTTSFLEKVEKNYPLLYQLAQYNPQFQTIQLLFELVKTDNRLNRNIDQLLKHNDNVLKNIESILSGNFQKKIRVTIAMNERASMKNEIALLRQGWEKCNSQLAEKQKELRVAKKGWEKCNSQLNTIESELSLTQKNWTQCNSLLIEQRKELNAAKEGWDACNSQLIEKQEELQIAKNGWETSNSQLVKTQEELQIAKKGWETCNSQLIEKQEELQIAKNGWEKCNSQLIETQEELQFIKSNWETCNAQLLETQKELENIKQSLKELHGIQ